MGDRRNDEIEALCLSAIHPLVHRAGREAAVAALSAYFQTTPVARDLPTMKPRDIAKLAHDYIEQNGRTLGLAMKDDKAGKESALDDLYRAMSAGWM